MSKQFVQTTFMSPNHFIHLDPKDDKVNASSFFNEFGGLFHVRAVGEVDGHPAVVMSGADEKLVIVEKRPDGIYVGGKLYCEKW